jgi:hypothetical protein
MTEMCAASGLRCLIRVMSRCSSKGSVVREGAPGSWDTGTWIQGTRMSYPASGFAAAAWPIGELERVGGFGATFADQPVQRQYDAGAAFHVELFVQFVGTVRLPVAVGAQTHRPSGCAVWTCSFVLVDSCDRNRQRSDIYTRCRMLRYTDPARSSRWWPWPMLRCSS